MAPRQEHPSSPFGELESNSAFPNTTRISVHVAGGTKPALNTPGVSNPDTAYTRIPEVSHTNVQLDPNCDWRVSSPHISFAWKSKILHQPLMPNQSRRHDPRWSSCRPSRGSIDQRIRQTPHHHVPRQSAKKTIQEYQPERAGEE